MAKKVCRPLLYSYQELKATAIHSQTQKLEKSALLRLENRHSQTLSSQHTLLLPSEGEGLPGVVMEAMSQGLPSVCSNIPCIPDLIDNNKNGFLCNKDGVGEFANNVNLLIKKKNLRDTFGKDARIKIKQFSWDKSLKKYEDLYSKLLK